MDNNQIRFQFGYYFENQILKGLYISCCWLPVKLGSTTVWIFPMFIFWLWLLFEQSCTGIFHVNSKEVEQLWKCNLGFIVEKICSKVVKYCCAILQEIIKRPFFSIWWVWTSFIPFDLNSFFLSKKASFLLAGTIISYQLSWMGNGLVIS